MAHLLNAKVNMPNHFLVLLITFGISVTVLAKPRKLVILWDKITCSANERYILNTTCRVRETDQRVISAETTFLKDISNINFGIRVFFPNNGVFGNRPFMNFNTSVCKFLMGSMSNNFLKSFRQALAQYSNFPNKCPFYKGVTYYVRNFTMEANRFPSFLPETRFMTDIIVYIPAKGTLFTAQINARLVDENKNNNIRT